MIAFTALVLVVVAGAALTLQAGVNSQLASWMGDVVRASFISSGITALLLLAAGLVAHRGLAPSRPLGEAPWWAWIGGPLGAFILVAMVVAAPRLGAATVIAGFATGLAIAALALDHFGAAGYPQHAVTPGRALGALLVVAGLVLVRAR